MISDLLDRDYVLSQTKAERDWLADLLKKAKAKHAGAVAALRRHGIDEKKIQRAIAALDTAIASADSADEGSKAFIPRDPITCALQAGMTTMADKRANTVSAEPIPPARRATGKAKRAIDTSPTERLKRRATAGVPSGKGRAVIRAAFETDDDIHYGLDGFMAKFGVLFKGRRQFNPKPARVASSSKPIRLFVFGDWGTGLPLAQAVTRRIREQLDASDGSRQQHVVHLGDVYYVGEADEYKERVTAAGFWPVRGTEREKIGSWSLNGNHDMYSGGHGYFDTLLRDGRFLRWHRDEDGEPSSFFLIEDANWQVFGLDTSSNLPSLASAIFGKETLQDYGGQNGILSKEQVEWMAKKRNNSKSCVLLTHHQAAPSRSDEAEHSDEAVTLLKKAGVYNRIDAWIWGHEHRCVVFKPKAKRTNPRLAGAPAFCACIGHGGVPVTKKVFAQDQRIADVEWEENRLDDDAPVYEGKRVVPFGFARLDMRPGAFDFRIFDHEGQLRYRTTVTPKGAEIPEATPVAAPPSRSVRRSVRARKPAAKKKRK